MHNDFFVRSEIACTFDKHIYQNCMILLNKYPIHSSKVFDQYLKHYGYFPIKGDE
jgi:hypothetical protein